MHEVDVTPNPYQASQFTDSTHQGLGFLRLAFGMLAILFGVLFTGVGILAAVAIAINALSISGGSGVMYFGIGIYLFLGLLFFASARFTLRRNARIGGILFAIPFVLFAASYVVLAV